MADKKPAAAAAAARPEGAGDSPPLPCPRCESTNTKFCYYNNYNLSQPRHFCKACRRYWTHGGTLRNIPVGGATRKHAKRCRTSRDGTAPNAIPIPITAPVPISSALPPSVSGSFTSLLSDGGLGLGLGMGMGMGWGLGYGFELGYGSSHGEGGLGEVGGSGGDTWLIGIGGGGGGGEVLNDDHEHHEQCFGWPELAIATSGKCAK